MSNPQAIKSKQLPSQVQITVKSEGKTKGFKGELILNCKNGKYDWKNTENFSEPVPRKDVDGIVPNTVIKNSIKLFCK